MSQDDFFIGWADTPAQDRRFFLKAGLALIGGTAVTAGALAIHQRGGGSGSWNMGDIREWTGYVTADPYPMLRTTDIDGTPRTALLGCQGKCGVSARINNLNDQPVVVKGSLIERGQHAMIAVIDGPGWIEAAAVETLRPEWVFLELETLGEVSLKGEILDTKCWFGAMQPSNGKVHKSCASLCIRSGLPPAFYVKNLKDQKALMIMTDSGGAHNHDILPYVADPVAMTATLQRRGDLLFLDAPVSAIARL